MQCDTSSHVAPLYIVCCCSSRVAPRESFASDTSSVAPLLLYLCAFYDYYVALYEATCCSSVALCVAELVSVAPPMC